MVLWDDLGFATEYSVNPEPEYPGDGNWGLRDVTVPADADRGGPQAVISTREGTSWVLRAAFADVGSLVATAHPRRLCVIDRFTRATLVDVDDPVNQSRLEVANPISVSGDPDAGLLYIADEQRVTAFGAMGALWRSSVLCDHDLRIRRADNYRVVCSGWRFSSVAPFELTLDARTGLVA